MLTVSVCSIRSVQLCSLFAKCSTIWFDFLFSFPFVWQEQKKRKTAAPEAASTLNGKRTKILSENNVPCIVWFKLFGWLVGSVYFDVKRHHITTYDDILYELSLPSAKYSSYNKPYNEVYTEATNELNERKKRMKMEYRIANSVVSCELQIASCEEKMLCTPCSVLWITNNE